ncbi:MAG: FkbM family methyltransferase [Acidimicrobiales bacterium]
MKVAINYRGLRKYFLRQEAFDLFGRFSPAVAVDIAGNWYFVSTSDKGVSRITFGQGSFEQDHMAETFRLIEELMGGPFLSDRTFIDVGANIGTSTIPAIRNFGASNAVAFEPEPQNYRLLRCNVIANDLEDCVQTFPLGLSDKSSTAELERAEASWGDHRIRLRSDLVDGIYEESSRPVIEVELATFDDCVRDVPIDLDQVGVVWMDIQGHEGQMLLGATTLTSSSIPVAMEYWPYGLRRADGLALLHDLIARHYSQVVDMRASMRQGSVVSLPADQIDRLAETYTGEEYTDLVLLS